MRAPKFWTGKSPLAQSIAAALSPVGALYGFGVCARKMLAHPYRAKARVVCVGNLTAGGSGKTPVAAALAQMIAGRGLSVVFLTRGYGGRLTGPLNVEPQHHSAHDVGDEALLLAAIHPTIVARDRAAGAKLADQSNIDVIVMDDGFQNFQLAKDVSIVVIDATTGFGNGRLLPAGPLRETPASGLMRANAVVMMGGDAMEIAFKGPVIHAQLRPVAPEALQGQRLFAFAGIGRPEKFFAMLSEYGADVTGSMSFADHHRYGTWELAGLKSAAEKRGSRLVTTEKDFVRLDPSNRTGIVPVSVRAQFTDNAEIGRLLDKICGTMRMSPP